MHTRTTLHLASLAVVAVYGLTACATITHWQADVMFAKGATYPDDHISAEMKASTRHFGVQDCAISEEERLRNIEVEKHNAGLASSVATPPVTRMVTITSYTTSGCGLADSCKVETPTMVTSGAGTPEAAWTTFNGWTADTYHVIRDGKALYSPEAGWVIHNTWAEGDQVHYFSKIVDHGFEYVVPNDPTKPGWRKVYRDVETERGSDGTLRPSGHPSALCVLAPTAAAAPATLAVSEATERPAVDPSFVLPPDTVVDPPGPCAIPPRPAAGASTTTPTVPAPADWGYVDGKQFLYTRSSALGANGTLESQARIVMSGRGCLVSPHWTTTLDGRPALQVELDAKSGARTMVVFVASPSGEYKRGDCGTYAAVDGSPEKIALWDSLKDASCAQAFAADPGL